jgi:small GTP-binding protein
MTTVADPLTFRVVLVGDSEAGKTSIIHWLVRGEFEPHQKNTVGAVFHTISGDINGQRVVMQVWDTAGQEKYRYTTEKPPLLLRFSTSAWRASRRTSRTGS